MSGILQSLSKTVHFSLGIAILLFLGLHFFSDGFVFDTLFWSWLFRFIHVVVAIMWIGLLWYFNFVQIPNMSKILAWLNGYVHSAMILGLDGTGGKNTAIGIGMWLGLIMAYNVWFVIWPNQKKALGMVEVTPEVKAASAKTAMLFSRTNTLLSLPMLLTMVAAQNLY